MSFRRIVGPLALLVALAAIAPAFAQEQQERPQQRPRQQRPQQQQPQRQQQQQPPQQQQQQQQQPQPPQRIAGFASGWGRICQPAQGNEPAACVITQEVFGENGNFLVSLAVQEARGNQRRQLITIVPLGIMLTPGILLRVDDQRAIPAKVGTCLPNGCFAGVDLGDDVARPMRQGRILFVTVRTAQGQALDLEVPLEGFATALDGTPMDQNAIQERQRNFQREIERRQQEFRSRVQSQQQQQQQQQPTPNQPQPAPANPAPGQ